MDTKENGELNGLLLDAAHDIALKALDATAEGKNEALELIMSIARHKAPVWSADEAKRWGITVEP